ncbi:universal stress protein [Blastococcus sp. SYSU D00820]
MIGHVVTQREEARVDRTGTVVVGVDDSPTSLRALAYAAGVARRLGGRLVVVHVRTVHSVGPELDPLGVAVQAAHEAREQLEAEIREEAARLAQDTGMDVRFLLRTGDPLRELTAIADREQADVVVVGASTRPAHRLAGSLGARLVRSSGWPVTVVP